MRVEASKGREGDLKMEGEIKTEIEMEREGSLQYHSEP